MPATLGRLARRARVCHQHGKCGRQTQSRRRWDWVGPVKTFWHNMAIPIMPVHGVQTCWLKLSWSSPQPSSGREFSLGVENLPTPVRKRCSRQFSSNVLRQCVRAAKEMDSKSIGLCPQGFESPRCRINSATSIVHSM